MVANKKYTALEIVTEAGIPEGIEVSMIGGLTINKPLAEQEIKFARSGKYVIFAEGKEYGIVVEADPETGDPEDEVQAQEETVNG